MHGLARRAAALGCGALLVLILSSCGGKQVTEAAEGGVGIARYIAAAETEQEYQQVWKKVPSAGQLERDQKTISGLDSGITRLVPRVGITEAETFENAYATTKAGVVTLIGHNEAGTFRFSDGSGINLQELGDSGPPIAVLSCSSSRYANGQMVGLPSTVSLQVAADLEHRLAMKIAVLQHAPSVTQLRDLLDQASQEHSQEYRDKVIALTTIGGATLAGAGITYTLVYDFQD